jgi:O-antigen ligase
MLSHLHTGSGAAYGLAFGSLWLFTLLLYMRPNDLFPAIGSFPIVKIVALIAPIAYIFEQSRLGKPLINWMLEVKMVFLLISLAILFIPAAPFPQSSIDTITDTFIKTVIVFVLIIQVVNTRERLLSLLKLVVICGAVLGFFAIKSFATGQFTLGGTRIEGLVGGMFGNPNDLATALSILVPLAITLAIIQKGVSSLFYFACAVCMAAGVLATFSRTGFLGLLLTTPLMLWKFGRGKRVRTMSIAAIGFAIFIAAAPGGYGSRVATIFSPDDDQTGSAQRRKELMLHTLQIAMRRPIVGVGVGNIAFYTDDEHVAHNSYLEVAAELGVIGLIAYLILIFAPIRALRKIENETVNPATRDLREFHYLSIGIQAAIMAYIVCSFFESIQYLWYIYYTAGYAVALRQIHAREVATSLVNEAALDSASIHVNQVALSTVNKLTGKQSRPNTRGSLWPSQRLHKAIR